MSFYTDTSFFVPLVLVVCGAAWVGLRERPLWRYGLGASLLMLACLFLKTLLQGAYAAGYIILQVLAAQRLWRAPKSTRRYATCLALAIAPLACRKVTKPSAATSWALWASRTSPSAPCRWWWRPTTASSTA